MMKMKQKIIRLGINQTYSEIDILHNKAEPSLSKDC